MVESSNEGYACLGCGKTLHRTGRRGGVRKRCESCVRDDKRRRERESSRARHAAARAARETGPLRAVACKHCKAECPLGRLTFDSGRSARKKAADAARHRRNYPKIQAARPREANTCVDCGSVWQRRAVKGPKPKRCAPCLAAYRRRIRKEQPCNGPVPTRIRNDRRRARVWGVDSERFERSEIFDRDRWVCQICREPVDRFAEWPDPKSPSLDHIIPISKGGSHTRANVRLADLRCNLSKNNKISDQDLEALGITREQADALTRSPLAR